MSTVRRTPAHPRAPTARRRDSVATCIAALVALGSAVPAFAQVIGDGQNVAVGTEGENVSARHVAVSNGGDASTWPTDSVALSTTGSANGYLAVSATGCSTSDVGVALSVTGCATGWRAGASGTGWSDSAYLAVSGTQCAHSTTVGVSAIGCAEGWITAASGTGNATGGMTAVSGTGTANSGMVAVSGGQANGYTTAVSAGSDASTGSPSGVAVSGTGTARGGVVAIAGIGYAEGSVASISGSGNASRDSLLTTNLVSPTSDVGIVDNTTYVYGGSGVDSYIGGYALAAMQAREELGITTGVDELTDAQDDAVRELIDQILLNDLKAATQGTLDTINSPMDEATNGATNLIGTLTSCPPAHVCASSYRDEYNKMNEQEQRVCRWEPYDCNRVKHTVGDSYEWVARRYGRNGHNDRPDAFRHCMWSALMTKRANSGFAKRMGDAHEDGDGKQPSNERYMDLHNNSWGREAGRNRESRSDTWIANTCQNYQRGGTLYWLR